VDFLSNVFKGPSCLAPLFKGFKEPGERLSIFPPMGFNCPSVDPAFPNI